MGRQVPEVLAAAPWGAVAGTAWSCVCAEPALCLLCHAQAMAGDRTDVREPQILLSEVAFLSDLEWASFSAEPLQCQSSTTGYLP